MLMFKKRDKSATQFHNVRNGKDKGAGEEGKPQAGQKERNSKDDSKHGNFSKGKEECSA